LTEKKHPGQKRLDKAEDNYNLEPYYNIEPYSVNNENKNMFINSDAETKIHIPPTSVPPY